MFKFATTDNTNLALDPPDVFVRIKIKREYHATMSSIIVSNVWPQTKKKPKGLGL